MSVRARARVQLRRGYHRARLAPMLRAAATGAMFRPNGADVSHLASYREQDASGPVQREEALLLFGAIRALRPKTLVEVGFFDGRSAFNFLRAMDDDAALYSFDIDLHAEEVARQLFAHDPRFHFRRTSQDAISAADVGGRRIDFAFLDASHELELNRRTWALLEPLLAPRALVAVHDTGTWARDTMIASTHEFARERPGNWISGEHFAHQPDERQFVNWLGETRPDLAQIHFHTHATVRHGLTFLQAGGPLAV